MPSAASEHQHDGPVGLLSLLQPVRHHLQPFLGDASAVRLLQTCRHAANDLLSGFAFVEHVFAPDSAAELTQTVAFCSRHNMRILRLRLPSRFKQPLIDSTTGESLLPASLIALTVGQDAPYDFCGMLRRSAAYSHFAGSEGSVWQADSASLEAESKAGDEADFYRRIRPVDVWSTEDKSWDVPVYGCSYSDFNDTLPANALPRGLRFLQLNDRFDAPLSAGGIPDSVEVLQLARQFNQPLYGRLPSSLTHLVLDMHVADPLLPGTLPTSLRRLRLERYHRQPLLVGSLPPQLEQLSLGYCHDQRIDPGAIPASVTHLKLLLSGEHTQQLQAGAIPHGVVHLHLVLHIEHPLPLGVLPSSLRELVLTHHSAQLLQPGSLPDGLEVLALHCPFPDWQRPLLPGLIPASVRVLSLNDEYEQEVVAGAIPPTVAWLRLPRHYAEKELSSMLSPSTRVVWWKQEEQQEEADEEEEA